MAMGFDISNYDMVHDNKKVMEPTNFQDQYDDGGSGAGGGNQGEGPAPNQSWSDYVDNVIPNIELSEDAKKDFINNLPKNDNLKYLGLGFLAYYLFFK